MKSYVDAAKLQEYTTKLVKKLHSIFPGTPLASSTVAGMTDHSKVYVYTGSETGYTAGNWYYWDGTAWASGGIYNSTAVATDTTLSVSGKAADAKAVGDGLTDLNNDLSFDEYLINAGLYSIKVSDLESGVWNYSTKGDNAARARIKNLLPVREGMTINYTVSTYDVYFGVLAAKDSPNYSGGQAGTWKTSSGSLNITANGFLVLNIRNHTNTSATFDPATWDGTVDIITQDKDILEKAVIMRGTLASGTDLDTVKTPGIWLLSSGYSYPHTPIPAGYAGMLLVFPASANSIGQIAYVMTSSMTALHYYVRSAIGGSYLGWKQMDGMPSYGILADNTDLDTLKQSGNWVLNSGYDYQHSPISSAVGGLLSVFPGSANSVVQIVTVLSKTNLDYVHLYVRCAVGGSFDTDGTYIGWKKIDGSGATYNSEYTLNHYDNTYNITCSPTITADANNYLASTGDDTDRTADIQSILDSTGVCHLGPGNFYVTGIEIPDDASLIGSGNGTVLYLAASITDGYAVKLKSRSSVSHMQIKGSTVEPALSADVGSRHGIIFESNIVSEQDGGTGSGTVYNQSAITNCGIANFTGGGITLTGTGVDIASNTLISDCFIDHCGAGIYIPYYSEYHRISNCAVTRCWYGTVDNGGNNNFSNCDFSGCRVGIQMSPSTNNSHGSFTNCSVNHSKSSTGEINKGTAILLQGATRGEIFTGMQIFYGKIEIRDSVGIRFIGANVGRQVPIVIEDNNVVTFTDCTFMDGPTSTDSPFSQSGNTVLVFADCYLRDGTVYNPMAG